MTTISKNARETLRSHGITAAAYVRHFYPAGVWGGDSCGCTDDRCIGYHHDANEDCGCVEVFALQLVSDNARDSIIESVAFLIRENSTRAYPTGLHGFTRAQLDNLASVFAAAVAEDEAMRKWLAQMDER